MQVLGEIIKKAVSLADKIISNPDPVEAQKKELRELLSKAQDTAFGKYYQFKKLLSPDDPRDAFAREIPIHSYDKMHQEWWQKVTEGAEDITWPGKVRYFAVSSGTTSKKKHIPVTDDMLKSIRNAGLQQFKGIADFDLPAEFFEKELLLFGSSTNLKKVNDHYEGEISGISASQLPFWIEGYYRPGKEISAIDDWDERVEALAKAAPHWDIGSISGIPSWIELMLKKVMEYHNLKNIHEIWPNFRVFTSGGVAFEPYKKSFERICGKPITVIDTYLASEGYLATQIRKDTDAMALITDNGVYFEFVPFKPENINDDGSIREGAKALKIDEVEEDVEYVLIISTVAGAWRYMIGDTIKFTDKKRCEIKITGRTKHYLNVVGSQLSVIQMNRAMEELSDKEVINVKEFTVAAILEEGDYLHRWYLGTDDDDPKDEKEIANLLDNILKDNNKNYKVARSKALKSVEVKVIPASLFQLWSEQTNQKGGQVKVARVMKEEDFKEWEAFVEKESKS
ncbi:MAG: GH3 auxin-responsive promoter [Bacteroidetes bacterium]|nr:MAG: GH3 auxin-responsive promoter [Bacteroidota bacterium]